MKKRFKKRDPLEEHHRLSGKIGIYGKARLKNASDWSTFYTPGVGAVSSHLAKHPEDARALTIKNNSVAIISDGSAVLGLGNIGPYAALPVMEGKALIFKELAGIDAFPIVLATQDPKKIIETIVNIAPAFGGINLEDIAAPHCFTVETELKKRLGIPVMHDDQHGTAVVVFAALLNACRVAGKNLKKISVTVLGAGAAGTGVSKLLVNAGVSDILVVDRSGVIGRHRKDLNAYKKELARMPTRRKNAKTLSDALVGCDALIAVSGPGSVSETQLRAMAPKSIVFALANPVPEIMPEKAARAGAFIVATGRSDFPNQVNNALVFPGIFRGALDRKVKAITEDMKIAAAKALASLVRKPTISHIIPSILDPRVTKTVARAIR